MSEMRDESSRVHVKSNWPPKGRARRSILGAAAVTAAAGTIMVLSAAGGASVAGAEPSAIILCHATASTTNPYIVIKVAPNSIKEKIFGQNGHATHIGPIFDPNGGKNQPVWGDIIPPFTYGKNDSKSYPGLNWTPDGQAILDNGCQIPGGTSTSTPPTTPVTTPTTPATTPVTTPTTPASHGTSGVNSHTNSHSQGNSHSLAATSNGPTPAGVSAGLHTPIANAGLKSWGLVLMILGGAAGLIAGAWPTRRRVH